MKASTILCIGDTIRKLREDKGWTQKKLSEKSGVHEVQIRRYEHNQAIPRDAQLSKIANALGVDQKIFTPHLANDINTHFAKSTKDTQQSSEIKPFEDIEITHDNTIIIDTALETPLNKALHKIQTGESLTEKEKNIVSEYYQSEQFKNAWEHMKKSVNNNLKHLKKLQSAYENLNDAGQEKVAEHAEMIAKIPEYRKDG